jgi:hypothetical protein
LPVVGKVTRTFVPNAQYACAAVSASWSKRSPLAVFFPSKPGPYQDAMPSTMVPEAGSSGGGNL